MNAVRVLISAMGGEGGGVLSGWITRAADLADLPVQRTSIPGVAQRTGATTYYIEIYPEPRSALAGKAPVLGLQPAEGRVDVLVATELLEAARAVHRGLVTPDRTLLLASTHRVFAMSERTARGDARFDSHAGLEAARKLARRAILFDMDAVARREECPLSAVLLGALSESGALPLSAALLRQAISEEGKSVAENLRGFAAGVEAARAAPPEITPIARAPRAAPATSFPAPVAEIVETALPRLADYQSPSYARLYRERLGGVVVLDGAPFETSAEAARQLALWMAYEDVIRVAQLKTKPARMAALRREAGARADDVVHVVDFLKPGAEEAASLLPRGWDGPFLRFVRKSGLEAPLQAPLKVRTSSALGFLQLRLLAGLRWWRPFSALYAHEQEQIETWLELLEAALSLDRAFARELAAAPALMKGYGDTRKRSRAHYARIIEAIVKPTLDGHKPLHLGADALMQARLAALKDETGAALEAMLAAYDKASATPAPAVHSPKERA